MLSALRIRLISDWRHAWKWSSMRFLATGAAVQLAVVSAPDKLSQHVPEWVMESLSTFALICIVLAGLGRVTTTEPPNVQHPDTSDAGR